MMMFYLWSNKIGKWWRAGAWGYTDDVHERGKFTRDQAMRFLLHSADDVAWTSMHDEPKTLALSIADSRWYALKEYDGAVPPTDPAEMGVHEQEPNVCICAPMHNKSARYCPTHGTNANAA